MAQVQTQIWVFWIQFNTLNHYSSGPSNQAKVDLLKDWDQAFIWVNGIYKLLCEMHYGLDFFILYTINTLELWYQFNIYAQILNK